MCGEGRCSVTELLGGPQDGYRAQTTKNYLRVVNRPANRVAHYHRTLLVPSQREVYLYSHSEPLSPVRSMLARMVDNATRETP